MCYVCVYIIYKMYVMYVLTLYICIKITLSDKYNQAILLCKEIYIIFF